MNPVIAAVAALARAVLAAEHFKDHKELPAWAVTRKEHS